MSDHDQCGRAGKFDCEYDQFIYGMTVDFDEGEGNVQGPAAWFQSIDLHSEDVHERPAILHYGAACLIARESSEGRFWVECYDTASARDERLEGLRAAHNEWDMGVL